MEQKVLIVAMSGELSCFLHVLLNVLDMDRRGFAARVVIEGRATAFIRELADSATPPAALYEQVKSDGLIDCVCRACATTTGALEAAQAQGLRIVDEMAGHPSLGRFIAEGYQLITL